MRIALLACLVTVAGAVSAARLYPDPARAGADIAAAVAQAVREGKRVLVDFGGDWCTDCKVLDVNMRRPGNAEILVARFVVVHVNVGDKGIEENFDIARRYGIPLEKGVPALAVLDARGEVVYAQKSGEFENMRAMDPASVHEFLLRWR
ncbi:MAG TPA: thioredoxin family protein [Usitatibacter sp.]|jgi:thiol:disulfide interchange protein|nr:thioredoxin family protein [Usitatibacter sp.]